MVKNLFRDSLMPPYMAYPRFLLTLDISETAKLIYVLLLDRARLSMKNEGWEDKDGHVFIHYTIESLASATGKSQMTIKDALKKLEQQGLILRQRQGAGKPSRIFVRVQTAGCPSGGTNFPRQTDRNLSANNNHSNNKSKTIRSYDYEEGESL